MLQKVKGGPGSGHFGHRGRPGIRGGSAPGTNVERFLLGSGLLLDWTPEGERKVARAARLLGTPVSHYDELESIMASGIFPPDTGLYDSQSNEILLAEDYEKGPIRDPYLATLGFTLGHELGHHVAHVRLPLLVPRDYSEETFPLDVQEHLQKLDDAMIAEAEGDLVKHARMFGMPYRARGDWETLADAYISWLKGNPTQQKNLRRVLTYFEVDPKELFAP